MGRWQTCFLLAALALAVAGAAWADHPPPGKIQLAGQPDQNFATIQAAIDAALAGGTVLVGEGRYDERLRITRPVMLVGAGPGKTVIGAVLETREAAENAILDEFNRRIAPLRANNQPLSQEAQKLAIDTRQRLVQLWEPIITIENANGARKRPA